jgi:tetratricopeptide (TPR) repeat protein
VRVKVNGSEHPRVLEARSTLADVLRVAGRYDEALVEARAAHEASRRLLGPDHFHTLVAQGSVATLLQDVGRYDESIALFEDAVARSSATNGGVNYETSVLVNNLAGRTIPM